MQPEMPCDRITKMEVRRLSKQRHSLAPRGHLARLAAPIHPLGHPPVAATLPLGRRQAATLPLGHRAVAIRRPNQRPAAAHPLSRPSPSPPAMAIVRRPKSSAQSLIKGPLRRI
jgi:hypothetical protein